MPSAPEAPDVREIENGFIFTLQSKLVYGLQWVCHSHVCQIWVESGRNMQGSSVHAVIAGDIVGSSKLSADRRRTLASTLTSEYEQIAESFGATLPYDIAISAGDEWRMYVERPAASLAAALAIWAGLKAREITTRVIVVVDTIDFIDEGDLNKSDGTAFRRAGRGLKSVLGDEWQFAVMLPRIVGDLGEMCGEVTGELVDILVKDSTAAQARAIAEMTRGFARGDMPTTTEVAERWVPEPISRQAVGKHLERGRWPVFLRTLKRFEHLIKRLNLDIP